MWLNNFVHAVLGCISLPDIFTVQSISQFLVIPLLITRWGKNRVMDGFSNLYLSIRWGRKRKTVFWGELRRRSQHSYTGSQRCKYLSVKCQVTTLFSSYSSDTKNVNGVSLFTLDRKNVIGRFNRPTHKWISDWRLFGVLFLVAMQYIWNPSSTFELLLRYSQMLSTVQNTV